MALDAAPPVLSTHFFVGINQKFMTINFNVKWHTPVKGTSAYLSIIKFFGKNNSFSDTKAI